MRFCTGSETSVNSRSSCCKRLRCCEADGGLSAVLVDVPAMDFCWSLGEEDIERRDDVEVVSALLACL
jgi:hypothetical protein